MQVDSWRARVGWVEVEHGVQKGFTSLCLAVEGCVDIVEQLVSNLNGVASGFCNSIPAVELLGNAGKVVVVAEERIEGTQGGPSSTEFLGGVTSEAAYICAHHWHLEKGSKVQHLGDGKSILVPFTRIISKPIKI